jgi:UDP-glucose 4-epimerase
MGRTVLITGAAGYIGRLTVKALQEERGDSDAIEKILALDVAEVAPAEKLDGIHYLADDICSPGLADLMRQHSVDVVVHLATLVRVPKGAPKDLAYRVDVEGTRNVLEACKAAGAKRLVVTSSGAAYGYHGDNPEWLDEEDALRGNDDFPYSRHKRMVEEMLAQWRADYPALKQLVFRPGTVVGPEVHSPVTDLFEKPVMIGVAGSSSPFVFIWDDDLVQCLVEGVLGDKTGIYNQAGDGAVAPRELAKMMRKRYVPFPPALLRIVLRTLKAVGLSEGGPERIKFLQHRPVLSNRRLKEEFGYIPRKSSKEAFIHYASSRGLL